MSRPVLSWIACAAALAAPTSSWALAGEFDPSFGNGGVVRTPIGAGYEGAHALVLQPDGKLVTAGAVGGGFYAFALVRYNPDGNLDAAFGVDGEVITGVGAGGADATALVLRADGALVAAGTSNNRDDRSKFTVVRYHPDGSLDNTFGDTGIVTTPDGRAYAAVMQPDGKVVVTGTIYTADGGNFGIVRYDADGTLDATFGNGGVVTTRLESYWVAAYAVALQADGKIVAAGVAAPTLALARYNPDGSLDANFGSGGVVRTQVPGGYLDVVSPDIAYAVVLQPDGKIVVAGRSYRGFCASAALPCNATFNDMALRRFNADGTVDSTFGNAGGITTPLRSGFDNAYALVLEPDGRLIAAGSIGDGSQ